jgi:hypothetical protein
VAKKALRWMRIEDSIPHNMLNGSTSSANSTPVGACSVGITARNNLCSVAALGDCIW